MNKRTLKKKRNKTTTLKNYTFFFISDIEGSYLFFNKCLKHIKKNFTNIHQSKLCILGDVCDRGTLNSELKVYKLIRDLQNSNIFDKTITVVGNRDLNKTRLDVEIDNVYPIDYPEFNRMTIDKYIPDKEERLTILLSKTFGIQAKQCENGKIKTSQEIKKILPYYFDYIKKSCLIYSHEPTKNEKEHLHFAHGCCNYDKKKVNLLNNFFESCKKIESGKIVNPVHHSYWELKKNIIKGYKNIDPSVRNHRILSDLGGEINWNNFIKKDVFIGAGSQNGPVNGSPNFNTYPCNDNWKSHELRGVVGHQPVGFFPRIVNNILCVDVSAASDKASRSLLNNIRHSFPATCLQFRDKNHWKIIVKTIVNNVMFKKRCNLDPQCSKFEPFVNHNKNKQLLVNYEIKPQFLKREEDLYLDVNGNFCKSFKERVFLFVGRITDGVYTGRKLWYRVQYPGTDKIPEKFDYFYCLQK